MTRNQREMERERERMRVSVVEREGGGKKSGGERKVGSMLIFCV